MSENILTLCLKTRVGSKIPHDQIKELRLLCEKNKHYSTLAIREDYSVETRRCSIGGRKRKYVCFVKDGKAIPITKNKLFEKTQRPCKHCGNSTCKRTQVIKAFRDSIDCQIKTYKKQYKKELSELINGGNLKELNRKARCAITNTPLQICPGGTHVDHVIPFSMLMGQFLKCHSLDLCTIELKGRGNKKEFKNFKLSEAWQEYHQTNAQLQLVCKKANLKKSNKY